jgi:hypothetical protein
MTQPVNLVSPSQLEATGAVRPSSVCHAELHLNRGKFPWDSNKVDFSKLELMAGSCVGGKISILTAWILIWGLELRFVLRDFEV